MKALERAAKILRYSGFKAKASYSRGVVVVEGISESDKGKLKSFIKVEVVAA
jgi:hypothetical protein